MSILLKNCTVVSTDENGSFNVLENSCLGVSGETIDYIGSLSGAHKYDSVKDMHGDILMPGLVNAHGHGPMTILRGVGSGLPLHEWLNDAIFPLEAKMTPETIKAGQTWAAMEMLRCGTTMVSEMYDFPWAASEVMQSVGMKANLCRVGLCFSDTEEIPPNRFNECVDFVKGWKDPRDRVRSEFCFHSEYLTTEKYVRAINEVNSELHAHVNIHVSETQKETLECMERHGGLSPVQYFEKCGTFKEPAYLAHCVWLSDGDMDIIRNNGVSVVHNPTSNMKLSSGFADTAGLTGKGVNVAIGTDGCASNDNLNMFEEMHIASLLQKGRTGDPTAGNASCILKMATVNGAKAMGHADTGMLKVGMKADIAAVSMDAPHMFPAYDILNLLVFSAQGSDVTMTMVNGDILYDHGTYTTIDTEKARYDMECEIKKLFN